MERHMAVFHLTGSAVLTTVASKIPVHILPKEDIYAYTTCDTYRAEEIEQKRGPYVETSLYRPLRGMSWVNSYGQILMWINCHWVQVLFYLVWFLIFCFILYFIHRLRRKSINQV